MSILITGANGFIGQSLANKLSSLNHSLILSSRKHGFYNKNISAKYFYCDLEEYVNWQDALQNTSVVIHCAARAHTNNEDGFSKAKLYKLINVDSTVNLAKQSLDAGVKKFIFISSLGVHGSHTTNKDKLLQIDSFNPINEYAQSKLEAEYELRKLKTNNKMEIIIIRPPTVYGPLVKGNFLKLLKLVSAGIPLPLAGINNKRSMISIQNLVDIIVCALDRTFDSSQIVFASDGQDISTTELISKLIKLLNTKTLLFYLPKSILVTAGYFFGKSTQLNSLLHSLQVDISHTRETLNWSPSVSIDHALKDTAQWYLQNH